MTDAPAGVSGDGDVDDGLQHAVDDDVDDELADDAQESEDDRPPGATATDVLEYLVRALVDDPDGVVIEVDDDRGGLRMQVSVAPGDMGRVIGRRGRIANAIRTVVRAAAVDDGLSVDVDFVD